MGSGAAGGRMQPRPRVFRFGEVSRRVVGANPTAEANPDMRDPPVMAPVPFLCAPKRDGAAFIARRLRARGGDCRRRA